MPQHNRGPMLGALALEPSVVASKAISATFSSAAWDQAAKAEQDAREAFQRYEREVQGPAYRNGTWNPDHDERYNELVEAHAPLFRAMLTTPAPHPAALAHKLERIQGEAGLGIGDTDFCALPFLIADARRLSGEA